MFLNITDMLYLFNVSCFMFDTVTSGLPHVAFLTAVCLSDVLHSGDETDIGSFASQ